MKNIPQIVNRTTASLTAATVILGLLYGLFHADGLLVGAIACGTTLYHTASRGLIGPAVTRFQDRLDPNSFWFRQHWFEPGLYKALRVKRWKDKLPTYAPQAFSLRDNAPETIIRSSCNAELVHEVCMAAGFLPLVMVPLVGAFWVFFLTSCAAAGADLLFVIIQRYNRPRLMRLAKKVQEGLK